jgi:ATP-binding cassette subfamily B protein
VGWLMSRLTADARELGRFFAWGLVDFVDGLGRILIMTVIMLLLDWRLALLVLAVVPLIAVIVGRFQALTLSRFRAVRRAGSELTAAFNEGIMGARTTKTLGREEVSLQEFTVFTRQMRDISVAAARLSAFYFPIVLFVGTVAAAAAVWYGGNGVVAGDISYGVLVAFAAYARSFFEPIQDLARRFPQLQNAQAAAERVFSILETEPEAPSSMSDEAPGVVSELPSFRGEIEFEHVSFAYQQDEPVLADFSLHVNPGETIALVGETGAGKTTIVNLLCRFYEPSAGIIRVDGRDCRQLPLAWLRRNLGIVQQMPHLFSGTVRESIRYGRLDATDAEVEEAARIVLADEFVRALPAGYETRIGEAGESLSSGQKQLLSLARAILANPRLLILDEATSAVDTATEYLIQTAIEKSLSGRTSFIVAHRLSTIRRADRILLIRDGKVVEQGSHHELIRRGQAYFQLYSSQFVEERERRIWADVD